MASEPTPIRLTDLDRAILAIQTRDPHASVRSIAEATGSAETHVLSRIRILDRGKVSRILAVLNLKVSGQSLCFVQIGIRGRAIVDVARDMAALEEASLVTVLSGGPFDLLVLLRFTSFDSLHALLGRKVATVAGVYRSDVSLVLDIPRFAPQYVRFSAEIPAERTVEDGLDHLRFVLPPDLLDEIDLQIVAELQHNARQSINAIGRKLDMAPSKVRYRIRGLETRKVMQFITILDPVAVGLGAFALMEIEVEAGYAADVVELLRSKSWLPQIFVTSGSHSIKSFIQAENLDAIMRIKTEELGDIKGIISISLSSFAETAKMDMRWSQDYR